MASGVSYSDSFVLFVSFVVVTFCRQPGSRLLEPTYQLYVARFGTPSRNEPRDRLAHQYLPQVFEFIMIKRTMFVLAVNDLLRSAQYYQDQLGFTVREIGDEGWRIFERDECQIMVGHCPDALSPAELGDHSYFAYVVVSDADMYYNEFNNNHVEFVKQIRSEPWRMREFGIRTIDGHRIMFGQPV
jgi:hypothetical protein